MALLKLAALGALGYAGYRYYDKTRREKNEAYARNQAGGENFAQVRDAGPEAMADRPRRQWTEADEDSDESFPASDPPANY
jgi:uncharacterized membrane protein YebE (DUF533 family)